MSIPVRKVIRTLQSELWFLKEPKELAYLWSRRVLRVPHDRDYRALRLLRAIVSGSYVDVGGNQGQSIESIRLMVPDANIVTFEPNPLLNRRLAKRYRGDPHVEVRAIGLGGQAGQMTLHVPCYRGFVYDGLSSLDPEAAGSWINPERVYFFRSDELTVKTFDCRVETLDSQLLVPGFVKIDVQGTEYDVVRGGIETIRAHQPVLMIEDFHRDPRLPELMADLGYLEFEFTGNGFVPMRGPSTNSFLLPTPRLAALDRRLLS